ncbi:hypothetical protein QAD02_007101 [Eretmocerus hayati]|uniref:Uncharacterized protein n=1 Tax=Eretmocerus hayati TaxID=131215 RepID=A0ACC2N2P0_9HYME|nr:hypothetical protein QAD02_007101 [Eretmocerus hayati]
MHTFLDHEKNDLFNVLNSSKKGRILLERYANDQYLDIVDLKDIVVYHYMIENFEITTPEFSVIKENTLKLFPCQANQVVYEAPGGGVGPRGYYYNHLRTIRNKARLADDLLSREPGESESNDNEDCDEEAEGLLYLTDSNKAAYRKEDVIKAWDDHYPERLELLLGNKKKRRPWVSVEKYFGSFKCLDQLMLILLDPTERSQKQEDYETWLRKRDQEILPYLILFGKVPNVEASICVNSHLDAYTNPLEAVQVYYKCLTALQRFPNLAEFAWSYIDLALYKFDFKSINSNVKKFEAKIESVKIVDSERQLMPPMI